MMFQKNGTSRRRPLQFRCDALIQIKYSELAQLAEHLTVNQVVAGSSPAFGAKKNPRPIGLRVLFSLAPIAGLSHGYI